MSNRAQNLMRFLDAPLTTFDALIISIAALQEVLECLSRRRGRWWLEYPITLHSVDLLHNNRAVPVIRLFHSLTSPNQVTDEVCFLLPVIAGAEISKYSLVCLAPELIRCDMEGLYYVDGRIHGDPVTDFERFWYPLKRAVLDYRDQQE